MNTQHHFLRKRQLCTAPVLSNKPPLSNQKEGVHLEQYIPRITKKHREVYLPRHHPDTEEPKFNPTCTIVHCNVQSAIQNVAEDIGALVQGWHSPWEKAPVACCLASPPPIHPLSPHAYQCTPIPTGTKALLPISNTHYPRLNKS